jgi:hypothetical protein
VTCTQSICHRRTAEVSWFYSATLLYIYEWKISLEQVLWWMEKEQKDIIVVEMKFA